MAEWNVALWKNVVRNRLVAKFHLLPPLDLEIFRAIACGIDAKAPLVIRQLWFHPSDLPALSAGDTDFETAALCCADLDYPTKSIWCPPHKGVRFPYLRAPQPHIWQKLVALHSNRPSDQRLFLRTARQYSAMLGSLTEKAFQTRFTWHTLRRGGATTRAHRGESAESIRRFGCWNSEQAVTHYVFPWCDIPLRHWRAPQPHSAPSTTASVSAQQPHPQQRSQPSKRSVHH